MLSRHIGHLNHQSVGASREEEEGRENNNIVENGLRREIKLKRERGK